MRSGTQLPELDRGHSNPCDLVLSAESNLAAGVLQQLAGIVLKALSVFPYVFVYDHFGVRWLRPGSWHSCTLALVLVDLVYYVVRGGQRAAWTAVSFPIVILPPPSLPPSVPPDMPRGEHPVGRSHRPPFQS